MSDSSHMSEFTINLISNASMETYPGNTLSCFTTLLPTPFTLPGEWQVALAEIAWPLVVQNVTIGEFSVAKKLAAPDRSEKRPERRPPRPGTISMVVPAAFGTKSRTPPKYTAPNIRFLKPGCYPSIDCILSAILKSATGKKVEGDGKLLTWKVDPVTRKLSVKFNGNMNEEGLTIQLKSQDLKNILGTSTIIDCQQDDDDDDQSMPVKIVKQVGQWPVDLNAGSHTMLLYCDLVQNETLGDTQTALLRSIPLNATRMWTNTVDEVNHKSFTNLQWKRVVKSQFQSISLTLANEVGQKMPFLSCGRTNVTLAFRPIPKEF